MKVDFMRKLKKKLASAFQMNCNEGGNVGEGKEGDKKGRERKG